MEKITHTKIAEALSYNSESGELVWKVRPDHHFKRGARDATAWAKKWAGMEALAAPHSAGYRHGRLFNSVLYAHVAAWALHFGEMPSGEIDHINGDKSDNRIENLRDVPHAVNQKNMRFNRALSGVSKKRKKWRVRLRSDNKQIHGGSFDCLGKAISARASLLREHGFHKNHGGVRN